MKTIALLPAVLLFLASCSSSSGFQEPIHDCGPGEELGIAAGLDIPRIASRESSLGDRLTMIVEVSNNSHHDVTVSYVRVQQLGSQMDAYTLDTGYREVNQTIAEGDDFRFEIPMTGRRTGSSGTWETTRGAAGSIALSVDVGLSTGAKYRCRFSVPSPV